VTVAGEAVARVGPGIPVPLVVAAFRVLLALLKRFVALQTAVEAQFVALQTAVEARLVAVAARLLVVLVLLLQLLQSCE